jgi:hypothetical protein
LIALATREETTTMALIISQQQLVIDSDKLKEWYKEFVAENEDELVCPLYEDMTNTLKTKLNELFDDMSDEFVDQWLDALTEEMASSLDTVGDE